MATDIVYEERLVAFLDFLGFKEWVDRSQQNSKVLAKILSAIDTLSEVYDGSSFDSSPRGHDKRLTQFSDSLVISYRVSSQSSIFWMLYDLLLRIIEVTGRGFLMRGGIAMGPMHHTEKHVVGPALVAAHKLESVIANMPRVIVDAEGMSQMLAAASKHHAKHHSPADERKYVRSLLVQDEDDGCYYLDYISWNSVVAVAGAADENYPEYFSNLGSMIRGGFRSKNPKVLEKILWMHRRFLKQLNEFVLLPETHQWRKENAELYTFYAQMDCLSREARQAENFIKLATRRPNKS